MKHLLILISLLLFAGCEVEQVLLPKEEVPIGYIYPEGSSLSVDHVGSVKELIQQVAEQEGILIEFVNFKDFDTALKLGNLTWRQLFQIALSCGSISYSHLEGSKTIEISPTKSLINEPRRQIAIQPTHLQPEEVMNRLYPLVDVAANEDIEVDSTRHAVVFTLRASRLSMVFEILELIDKPSPISLDSLDS
ncbi:MULTISPECIES: hypothetical protein [unclassified Lentimonas]|uniref:hypothetical protein n=1 Tax=unclassified Lentimonas TaxID=2630993 RepID=UPI00132B0DB9|nr:MULTISPECIES: hypothetical protein [unclassified Lentimonas]CAA6679418.1 Unannotated [Lentimonas sp. CC4]CAA6687088.1 Unannotated [Lentimonas sp. CC6]CAA7075564.1 Unannotated [Lentimonas sp. CC4]CAA7170331.1 Unannotated [Lentimonas sp. CC21]CAA7182625.1 Unannotated [Lentimonas sp. CC8]